MPARDGDPDAVSNPPDVRRALVDPSLLVPYSTRLFIGHLAEIGGVVLIGSRLTRQEEAVGLNNRHSRLSQPEAALRVTSDMAELDRWRSAYGDAGLWCDLEPGDRAPALVDRRVDDVLRNYWSRYRTDPEDEYLAETAVMCELDALLSANMNMISAGDWDALMGSLGLSQPPALCRRGAIIDWMLEEDGVADEPDRIVDIIVGAMRSAQDLKTPLLRWARNVEVSFPELSREVADYLSRLPESALQEQHRQHALQPQHRVTRRYLAGRARTP